MKLNDFVTDPAGTFSVSKFWTNVAYLVTTIIIVCNYDKFDYAMLLAYTGVIGGSEVAKKLLTLKYGSK